MNINQDVDSENNTEQWSAVDKRQFLDAVRKHGIFEKELITNEVTSKSTKEVDAFIRMNIKKAKDSKLYQPQNIKQVCSKKLKSVGKSCLDDWLHVLQKHNTETQCKQFNSLAFVMKLIANYGNHTPPSVEDGVDFPNLYIALNHLLQGARPILLNTATKNYFISVLQDLAKIHRIPKYMDYEKKFLTHLKNDVIAKNKTSSQKPQVLSEFKEPAWYFIANSKKLNPLNITVVHKPNIEQEE